jgi:hypothetical protein
MGGTNPHDKPEMSDGITSQHLKGDISSLYLPYDEEHMLQANKFSTIAAKAVESGKKSNSFKIVINPSLHFSPAMWLRPDSWMAFSGIALQELMHSRLFRNTSSSCNSKNRRRSEKPFSFPNFFTAIFASIS